MRFTSRPGDSSATEPPGFGIDNGIMACYLIENKKLGHFCTVIASSSLSEVRHLLDQLHSPEITRKRAANGNSTKHLTAELFGLG